MIDSPIPEPDSVVATIAVTLFGAPVYVVVTVLVIRSIAGWARTITNAGRTVANAAEFARTGYKRFSAESRGKVILAGVSAAVALVAIYVCARWVSFSLRQDLPHTSGWSERFAQLLVPPAPTSVEALITLGFVGVAACFLAASLTGNEFVMWVASAPIIVAFIGAGGLALCIGGAGLVFLVFPGLTLLQGRGYRTEQSWLEQTRPELLMKFDGGAQLFFAGTLYAAVAAAVVWLLACTLAVGEDRKARP